MGRHSAPGRTPAGRAPATQSAEEASRHGSAPREAAAPDLTPAPDQPRLADSPVDLAALPARAPAPLGPVPEPPDLGAVCAPGIEVLAWTAFGAVVAWAIIAAAGHDLSDATGWALGVALLVPVALLVRAPAWLRERRARRGDQ